MLISEERNSVSKWSWSPISPLFMLERNGSAVEMTVSTSAEGYYDDFNGYWFWDGELITTLGSQEGYVYQTFDRPLDAFLTEQLTPGEAITGSYYVNYGVFDVSFNVILFDAAANYTGGDGRDFVFGSEQADVLSGGLGDDGFEGAGGNDVITGGAGADLIDGGDGIDTASYAGASAGVTANLANAQFNTGEAAGDRLIAIENLIGTRFADSLHGDGGTNIIRGNGGSDFIFGHGGTDTLDGGAGADAIFGGTGNDFLVGGAGGDILNGEGGPDTASYATAKAGVTASLMPRAVMQGDAAGDVLMSIENITGSRFNDKLTGNSQSNVIEGGAGDDVIRGNGGADTLSGGAGLDIFFFVQPDAADRILDYSVADDRIVVDDISFLGLAAGRLDAEAFGLGAEATTSSQRILYDTATGELRLDSDGTGPAHAALFAILTPGLAITDAEFNIV